MATPIPSPSPSMVAAMPPPPGIQSNFTNPPTTGGSLYIFTIIGLIIAACFMVMRLYTKAIILKKFGAEDATIIIAFIFTVATCTLQIIARIYGTGRHMWDIPVTTLIPKWGEVLTASEELYLLSIMSAKLAVVLCYLRISPDVKFRMAIFATIAFVVSYHFALMLALIFACTPIQRSWNFAITTGHCINRPAAYLINGVLNVVSDFIILLLPLPMIKNIQMPLRQKILVGSFFSVGSLACVIGIVRLVSLVPILNAPDATWVNANGATWVAIELCVVITCGCLSVMRPFLLRYVPFLAQSRPSVPSSKYSKGVGDFFLYRNRRGQADSAGSITQLGQPYHTDSSWNDTGYVQEIRANPATDGAAADKVTTKPGDLEMNAVSMGKDDKNQPAVVSALGDGEAKLKEGIMMTKEVDVHRKGKDY